MNLQGRNLSINLTGPDVALLHTELAQLGYTIPTTETGAKSFGPGTLSAVQDFQRKRGIAVTGIVDARTAKAINAAILPPRFSVSGLVRHQDGTVLSGLTVRAFDQDMRSEKLLGEANTDTSGHYAIVFTRDKLGSSDDQSPDLIVRAFSPEGTLLAASVTLFNAPAAATVDLVIMPQPAVTLSEYEQIVADIEPLRGKVPVADLTAADIAFLAGETGDPAARILMLQQGTQFAGSARIPPEAFYGWLRQNLMPGQPPDFDQLLALPATQLQAALTQSISAAIIPATVANLMGAIMARIAELQRERQTRIESTFTQHRVIGQLLDQQSGDPLPGFHMQSLDLDAGPQPKDLGHTTTNAGGFFGLIFTAPPSPTSAPSPPPRKLRLQILTPDGQSLAPVDIAAVPDTDQPVQVKIVVPAAPQLPSPTFAVVDTTLHLNLPPALVTFLAGQGIQTLADIRKAGGIGHLKGLPVPPNDPAVRALEAHASLSQLSSDLQLNATLIQQGFNSPAAIARSARSDFVGSAQTQLGDVKAAEMQVIARGQTLLLHNATVEILSNKTNGFDHPAPTGMPDITGALPAHCGCDDCEAAVSPLAYLADLLDYGVRHVKNNGKSIDLQFLTDTFHQPFADLPTSCEQMDLQVRQVRICIEVLRRFLTTVQLSPGDQAFLADQESSYCLDAYTTLLKKIGSGFDELRLAVSADPDTRQNLADRLGIDLNLDANLNQVRPDNLDNLLTNKPYSLDALATPPVIAEADLELLFGLVDTTRDALSDGVKFGDTVPAQITRWEFSRGGDVTSSTPINGVEWNRNTDADGNTYVTLDNPSANLYRVQIFRDVSRTPASLVAQGTCSTTQGTVQLAEQNGSGLAGMFDIAYTSGSAAIVISVVSKLLSWRFAHLRKVWAVQDRPVDLYSQGTLPKDLQTVPRPPIIDPDVIGPDDFRNPAANDPAFSLWLQRRQYVDAKLKSFDKNKGLDSVLTQGLGKDSSYLDGLMAQLAEGTPAQKTAAQAAFTQLNLTSESLARLAGFRTQPPATDDDWNEIFSILTQADKINQFAGKWILEEQNAGLLLGSQAFWISLREPAEGDWPPSAPLSSPLIDPETMKLEDLPEPVAGAAAISFWTARRQQLDQDKLNLRNQRNLGIQNPQTLIPNLLSYALGDPNPNDPLPLPPNVTLNSLSNDLNSPNPAIQAAAQATLQSALHMSPPDFAAVMMLDAKLKQSVEPADSEWAQLYAILASAQKVKRYFSVWTQQEQAAGLTPATYWMVRKAQLPHWRSSAEARALWQQGLRVRSQPPVIDPDLIGPQDLRDPLQGPVYSTWDKRQIAIANQMTALQTARESLPKALDGFNAILTSGLGISADDLGAIDQDRLQGGGINKRLDQLTLPMDAFLQLIRVYDLAKAGQPVLASEWQDVYAILTQVFKRRLSTQWRAEEAAANLMLGPDDFMIPDPPPITFPPQTPPPLPAWRATTGDRQNWQDTLQSRIDSRQSVQDAMSQAVDAAEEAFLTELRDALIWVSNANGWLLDARAKWLQDRLLIDCKTGGCQLTTRVAQAIETVQVLLFSLRQDILRAAYANLDLDADNFDLAWEWLGSYTTWRAAMFVFIYPENILIPSLRSHQTPAFGALVDALRSNRRLTPDQANDAAAAYASYYSDICRLKLEAVSQTRTRLYVDGRPAGFSYLFYMFARGATNALYWSAYDPEDASDYAQTFWEALPGVNNVIEVVGATPYEMPWSDRFLYLFCTVREKGVKKLSYTRYDLNKRSWDTEPTDLDLPDDATDFSAIVKQQISETTAPELAFKLRASSKENIQHLSGIIYSRSLNEAGSDWAGEDWTPLTTPDLGNIVGDPCAWVETASGGSCLIALNSAIEVFPGAGTITYRLFGKQDDGEWHGQNGFFGPFLGAVCWPGTNDVDVLWRWGNTVGLAIKTAQRTLAPQLIDRLDKAETWLNAVAGLSLKSIPTNTALGSLSLYDLLSVQATPELAPQLINLDAILRDWAFAWPPYNSAWPTLDAWNAYLKSLVQAMLELQQAGAIASFAGQVDGATDFRDKNFGAWKIADALVRQFSNDPNSGLGKLLLGLLPIVSMFGIPIKIGTPVSLSQRSSPGLAEYPSPLDPFALFSDVTRVLYANGTVPDPIRQFGYQLGGQNRPGRGTLSRKGDALVASATVPVAPFVTGPFDIRQRFSDEKLQARRALIAMAFNTNLKHGPLTNLTYLEEAYCFVPVHLALQLQGPGEYTAALDWFRTVYDYATVGDQRKIYYGLVLEEKEPSVYQRAANWLLDPLNPHEIAAARRNTYTRFTVMSIVQCLFDYADSEFTSDTPETDARARVLYREALDLLDTSELKQNLGQCDDVVGSLGIQVGDPVWNSVWNAVQKQMRGIKDATALTAVAGQVKVAMAGSEPWSARLAKAQSFIRAARAALPAPPRLGKVVSDKADLQAGLHAAVLAQPDLAAAAEQSSTLVAQDFRRAVSVITGVPALNLQQDKLTMSWLRQPSKAPLPVSPGPATPLRADYLELTQLNPLAPTHTAVLGQFAVASPMQSVGSIAKVLEPYIPAPSYQFCIPVNPILQALRLHGELNLYKLRTCRNIAGMKRQLDPYAAPTDTTSGMPVIGPGGQLVLPGLANLPPTPYRYTALIDRAKQMAGMAQQVESSFLSVLEKADVERYNVLKARQDLNLARAGVRLQTLRVKETQDGVKLAQLQQQRAQIQVDTYQQWIDAGVNAAESAQMVYLIAQAALSASAGSAAMGTSPVTGLSDLAGAAGDIAGASGLAASWDRRSAEWQLLKSIAQEDVLIGGQQITIAEDSVRVTDQELTIAQMQADNNQATVDFLSNKFTNVELYDWMGNVLEGVYSFFLQQATSLAQLAANQLAFERQQVPPPFIQTDYWQAPGDVSSVGGGKPPDRRGLTGSARLLQDITQLDQYAFDTNTRKLQLTRTISLAQLAPFEFQQFRETGVLPFATTLDMFDRDFPGHYLRLIRRVRVSVIALIPPSQGIRATLSTTGTSRVVIGGDVFQTVRINRSPDEVALSLPRDATGLFELDQQPEMLLPFEGMGVDTHWELRMPKAANLFDYSTIADVLISIDYCALNSFDYQQQVLQTLRPILSADRPFSFRYNLADAWYDLHNPDQTATPMTVQFTTSRQDFPPNLQDLRIQQILLYFSRDHGQTFEVPVTSLSFAESGASGSVGGGAMTVDGLISTRGGNAGAWVAMIGRPPFGDWTLALPNHQEVRDWFQTEAIQDMMFVITFSGRTPAWPA